MSKNKNRSTPSADAGKIPLDEIVGNVNLSNSTDGAPEVEETATEDAPIVEEQGVSDEAAQDETATSTDQGENTQEEDAQSEEDPTPVETTDTPSLTDGMDQTLEDALTAYVTELAPSRPVEPVVGARYQVQLWRAIQHVLALEGSAFVKQWSALLAFVDANKLTSNGRPGVFSAGYAFRYFSEVKIGASDRRNFERMLNLITITAERRTRQLALKQVDMKATLSGFNDEAIRQKLIGFYQV